MIAVITSLSAKVLDPSAPMGSRKNPIPMGELVSFHASKEYVDESTAILSMGVIGVVRGDKADSFLNDSDSLVRTRLHDGYEFVLPIILVSNLKDLTGNDDYFYVNQGKFEFADSGYSHKKFQATWYTLDEPFVLDSKLYEGIGTSGMIECQAPIGDECYLYYEGIWFELGSETVIPENDDSMMLSRWDQFKE